MPRKPAKAKQTFLGGVRVVKLGVHLPGTIRRVVLWGKEIDEYVYIYIYIYTYVNGPPTVGLG